MNSIYLNDIKEKKIEEPYLLLLLFIYGRYYCLFIDSHFFRFKIYYKDKRCDVFFIKDLLKSLINSNTCHVFLDIIYLLAYFLKERKDENAEVMKVKINKTYK
jgi:hypothetical protein